MKKFNCALTNKSSGANLFVIEQKSKTFSRHLWFPLMKENRGADIYRPKRPRLRLMQNLKGKTHA